ncbi:MAG: hypothetical protein IE909_18775, partial [Campylobacterales bacterium]|nr:hypothetical protein [Campylobacterales bacterium]
TIVDTSFIDYGLENGVDEGKILVPNLFTIDPVMFEHMAYHISDWFQFGLTSTLLDYWSSPFMSEEDATYYDRVLYRKGSSYMDKQFRPRLGVEQYIACNYAERKGYVIPKFHNDINKHIIDDFYRFIRDEIIVMDVKKIGLTFPKYDWAYDSGFQDLNCISNQDYLIITGNCLRGCISRIVIKKIFQKLSFIADYFGFFLYRKNVKGKISTLIKIFVRFFQSKSL